MLILLIDGKLGNCSGILTEAMVNMAHFCEEFSHTSDSEKDMKPCNTLIVDREVPITQLCVDDFQLFLDI